MPVNNLQELKVLSEAVRDLEDSEHEDELAEAKDALWLHIHCHTILELIAEIEKTSDESERLRMQLAACGVVALSNTRESAQKQREMHPDYMSASCQEVIRAVDSEMDLREQCAQLKAENESLRKDAERWRFVRNPIGNASTFAVWSERTNLFLGKHADEAIDAAMSQAAMNTYIVTPSTRRNARRRTGPR